MNGFTIVLGNPPGTLAFELLGTMRENPATTSLMEFTAHYRTWSTLPYPAMFELVIVTPSQLGLIGQATSWDYIRWAAGKCGLSLCPPETAVQIILQGTLKSEHREIHVAMSPRKACLSGCCGAIYSVTGQRDELRATKLHTRCRDDIRFQRRNGTASYDRKFGDSSLWLFALRAHITSV